MEKDTHPIDEIFTDELGRFEVTPPDSVWQAIEERLDKKKRLFWLNYRFGLAAGIAVMVSLGTFLFFTVNHQNKLSDSHLASSVQQKNSNPVVKKSNPIDAQHAIIPSHNDRNLKTDPKDSDKENETSAYEQLPVVSSQEPLVSVGNSARNTTMAVEKITPLASRIAVLPSLTKLTLPESKDQVPTTQLAFVPENPYAYDTDVSETKPKQKWSIEGQLTPLSSYRNIVNVSNSYKDKGQYNNDEHQLIAYSGGIKVNMQAGKRISFQGGVYYSVMGQTSNLAAEQDKSYANSYSSLMTLRRTALPGSSFGPISIKPGKENYTIIQTANSGFNDALTSSNNNLTASSISESNEDSKSIVQLKVIEVPLLVRYKLTKGKVGLHLLGGATTNILVGQEFSSNNPSAQDQVKSTQNLTPVNYSATVGFGMRYGFLKNVNFIMEPTFKYFINSVSKYSNYNVHPYSFGLYTGFSYTF